ncbi:hypothetical protein BDB01DRAFT_770169 [Pilobolus umbonatus]|nr:hypothetical protein BDB01DRAFT_770169 [Pilobolus umbonatus]
MSTNPEEKPFDREIKVLGLPQNAAPISEVPESVYKLSPNEVKQLYQSAVEYRQSLENRPLKTEKMRTAEEQDKLKKYPRTTIRIRMPNHIILQAVFRSTEKVSALYEFVKTMLETPDRKFLLCLPPRTKLSDTTLSLFKAGLAPASNVLFIWIDKSSETDNGGNMIKKEYYDMKQDLSTTTPVPEAVSDTSSAKTASSSNNKKHIPKWLQKGLLKKK